MTAQNGMTNAEEGIATHRKHEGNGVMQLERGAGQLHSGQSGYSTTLLRHPNLRGRSNGRIRERVYLEAQHIHGNRAVQRQVGDEHSSPLRFMGPLNQLYEPDDEYTPSPLVPFGGPLTTLWDYSLDRLGRPDSVKGSTADIVQNHIASIQGMKAFHEAEQTRKHEVAIDDAQRALTGLPPDWFAGAWEEPPGTLETPQYDDVSPALNPWELDERAREREMYEAMGIQ